MNGHGGRDAIACSQLLLPARLLDDFKYDLNEFISLFICLSCSQVLPPSPLPQLTPCHDTVLPPPVPMGWLIQFKLIDVFAARLPGEAFVDSH